MLKLLVSSFFMLGAMAQNTSPSPAPSPAPRPLLFTDTTLAPIVGNYTMGYVNNTVENRCHRATAKFQSQNTGIVDMLKMGVYSQAAPETCGISFVLATFPAAVGVGNPLLTTFTDLVAATPGTDEFVKFNATPSAWSVVAGHNYTVTILPFTWATAPSGGTAAPTHCVFQIPYGRPGIPYAAIGQYGPTGQPCGTAPWTTDLAGDGWAIQILLNGHAAQVIVPSVSSTVTPTPTSTQTPTPSQTGTPTPSQTPTGTPTITDTPTPTIAPGSTPSNSATNTRTPSRTPSLSESQTPSSSLTPSQTPTMTPSPTPTLRIGASPSVTPTETPGPTDSPSPTSSYRPLSAINQQQLPPQPTTSPGVLIGAVVGGVLLTLFLLGLAIRYNIVSAQLNARPQVAAWRTRSKTRVPDVDVNMNPHLFTTNVSFRVTKQNGSGVVNA